jgi:hypothetical protein
MLVCTRRACALVKASLIKYALVLVYGLCQHVPAPGSRTASNVLQYANCLKSLCNLSREGNVGVVLCNSVWGLPQCVVYVGHGLNDAVGAQFASMGSADVVLVRANGDGVLERKHFVTV